MSETGTATTTLTTLTGERLDSQHKLYQVDLARHEAAYAYATRCAAGLRVLDLGCGTGYGASSLSRATRHTVAVDRVKPAIEFRTERLSYVRADLNGIPLLPASFDLVVSFQVIEHLPDPTRYLETIAAVLAPHGQAILTTPNIAQSDRENPFHVHEYEANELAAVLRGHFGGVEMFGVGMSKAVGAYQAQRLARIRRITRLDPLGLRRRLPRSLIDFLFARFSILVRSGIQKSHDGMPNVTIDDYPIGPADAACLDLLAVCSVGGDVAARQPEVA